MRFQTTETFDKLFQRLGQKIQIKAAKKTDLFKKNPFHPCHSFPTIFFIHNLFSSPPPVDYYVAPLFTHISHLITFSPSPNFLSVFICDIRGHIFYPIQNPKPQYTQNLVSSLMGCLQLRQFQCLNTGLYFS